MANRWLGVRLEIVGALVIFFAALFAVLAKDTISGGEVGLSISYALQITVVLSFLVRMTAEGWLIEKKKFNGKSDRVQAFWHQFF